MNRVQGNNGEKIMTSLKAMVWVLLTVFVATLTMTADADARNRKGSHRNAGCHSAHGKGCHYVGGR